MWSGSADVFTHINMSHTREHPITRTYVCASKQEAGALSLYTAQSSGTHSTVQWSCAATSHSQQCTTSPYTSVQYMHMHTYCKRAAQPMLLQHKCSDTYVKTTRCFVNVSVLNDPWNPPHCRKGNCKRNHDMTLKGLARVQAGTTTAM